MARQFDWVWLSTDAQIAVLTNAYRSASLATNLLGRYDIPSGVAHVRGVLTPWARIPLAFVIEGELTVTDRG